MKAEARYKFIGSTCEEFFMSFRHYERGEELYSSVKNFCKQPDIDSAEAVFLSFLSTYRCDGLSDLTEAMKKFEITSGTLIQSQRDHYIHSVNVFLLGICLFYKNSKINDSIRSQIEYPDRYSEINEEFLYRWGLIALFHDIGYPIEIAYKSIREFSTKLLYSNLVLSNGQIVRDGNLYSKDLVITLQIPQLEDILYLNKIPPKKEFLEEFSQKYPDLIDNMPNNSFNLVSAIISEMGYSDINTIQNRVETKFKDSLNIGEIDHGIFSTIIFLKWLNDAFIKSDWNPAYYYYPIANAACAIFLHNTYDYIFMKPPFSWPKLSLNKNPLAYLLILCDRVQEYDRVSYGHIDKGCNIANIDLQIDEDNFILSLIISKNQKDMNFVDIFIDDIIRSVKTTVDIDSIFNSFSIKPVEQ